MREQSKRFDAFSALYKNTMQYNTKFVKRHVALDSEADCCELCYSCRYYFDVFIEKYSIFRVHLLSNSVNLITFTGCTEKVGPQTHDDNCVKS